MSNSKDNSQNLGKSDFDPSTISKIASAFNQWEQAVLTSTKLPGDEHGAYDPNAGTKTEKTTIPKAPLGK